MTNYSLEQPMTKEEFCAFFGDELYCEMQESLEPVQCAFVNDRSFLVLYWLKLLHICENGSVLDAWEILDQGCRIKMLTVSQDGKYALFSGMGDRWPLLYVLNLETGSWEKRYPPILPSLLLSVEYKSWPRLYDIAKNLTHSHPFDHYYRRHDGFHHNFFVYSPDFCYAWDPFETFPGIFQIDEALPRFDTAFLYSRKNYLDEDDEQESLRAFVLTPAKKWRIYLQSRGFQNETECFSIEEEGILAVSFNRSGNRFLAVTRESLIHYDLNASGNICGKRCFSVNHER